MGNNDKRPPARGRPEPAPREWKPRKRQTRNVNVTKTLASIAVMLPTLQAAEVMFPVIPHGTAALLGSLIAGIGGVYNHVKKDD